ncbi:unnamed protein product [Acanthoscelides obtectus]|uniref:DDE Tnp4 domain-containing protein n=1 Tax=Acanthoscelides obtectus TaxID=200917 RepID=A0A9P0KQ89_ACAOB|nr:unnamed protein product [Acanthoscelides obtectus]CAK1641638.1 Protein ALP1-like [Acanthoscelides obtectus]
MAPLSKLKRNILIDSNPYMKWKLFLEKSRRYGIHPINKRRKKFGEFHHLYVELREYPEKFFEYLRMSISTYDFLLSKVNRRFTKIMTNYRSPISAEERLVVTLRYLATGSSFRSLAFAFRMGKSTVSNIVFETCQIIWEELVEEFMPIPTENCLKKVIADYFNRWKFPNCFGSIDGKHCQIRCPPNSGSHYFNYLHYFSVVLQAVADADKKFLTIEVGGRGKQSDGGTFAGSTIFNLLESNFFNVPRPTNLPNTNIELPYFLIGDEAYPLKSYLMRPYPRRGLNPKKEYFNKCLSTARKCIECAFGILCAKWRFLNKDIETLPDKACILIKCACILHNLVRDKDGDSDLHYRHISGK